MYLFGRLFDVAHALIIQFSYKSNPESEIKKGLTYMNESLVLKFATIKQKYWIN